MNTACPICENIQEIDVNLRKREKNEIRDNNVVVLKKISQSVFNCEILIKCKSCRNQYKINKELTLV